MSRLHHLVWGCLALVWMPTAASAGKIDFDRQIRPILSNNCFQCHGYDAAQRQAGLRLDVREAAVAELESGSRAVVPGKPEASELLARVTMADADLVMPPKDSNKTLTAAQKDLLRQWIAEGAEYKQHWSFTPVVQPALPQVAKQGWARNEVDLFILARLEVAKLAPSPEADAATLIRRLSLDLTGLPPTPEEVEAFVKEYSDTPAPPHSRTSSTGAREYGGRGEKAYLALVEKLLASPHFGERMALEWLDASRYADTHGFHIDSHRDMWPWRDWVIGAFNRNLPFDRFTIEQLAGDLLPNATTDQQVASGFNRNHMINFEGGAIPEEYHTAYIVDRVNTTGTVWLGLSVGCAQCHDHKYDPISQREYYQLYAFFHNVPENGLDGRKGNAMPVVKLAPPEDLKQLDALAAEVKALEAKLNGAWPELDAAQAKWEPTALADGKVTWTVLEPRDFKSEGKATLRREMDQAIIVEGTNPSADTYTVAALTELRGITAVRLETLPEPTTPTKGLGRSENGNFVLTEVKVAAGLLLKPEDVKPLKLKSATADFSQAEFPVNGAIDGQPSTGWAIFPDVSKPHTAVFELERPLAGNGVTLVNVTLEFRSQFSHHQMGRFRLAVTDATDPSGAKQPPDAIKKILATAADKRSDKQKAELRTYYRTAFSPEFKQLTDKLAATKKSQAVLEEKIPTAMVMQELPQPRDTFLLVRGQYDKKGDKVTAGVPASLPPLPAGAPANRLGLAQWLVDPANPLVARVAVNRYWQMFFGTGLVKTAEDFGIQGEQPSHGELLDWLAGRFARGGGAKDEGGRMKDEVIPTTRNSSSLIPHPSSFPPASSLPPPVSPWDIKSLIRLIVTSSTYRQASRVTPELASRDPENRLLARGARVRLQAEFIRDQALAVSGLMNDAIGGKSVFPYEAPGLWDDLAFGREFTAQKYTPSHGADLYRRSMYTFWKRTVPPSTMSTFDAPDRETCTLRRARTNTPLQALVLMNEPLFVEASRKLAERMLTEGGSTTEERLAHGFQLCTARRPSAEETAVLKRVLERQLDVFQKDPAAAAKLLAVGESKRDEKLAAAELAAWTTVASVLLNLDETITKG